MRILQIELNLQSIGIFGIFFDESKLHQVHLNLCLKYVNGVLKLKVFSKLIASFPFLFVVFTPFGQTVLSLILEPILAFISWPDVILYEESVDIGVRLGDKRRINIY